MPVPVAVGTIPAAIDPDHMSALAQLTPDEQAKAKEIAASLDIRDSMAVMSFGTSAQKDIDSFSDVVLSRVKTKDAGEAGETLTGLLVQIRQVDAEGFVERATSFMARIPLIGGMWASADRFISGYESVGEKVDRIVVDLDRWKNRLAQDIAMLDGLYDQNLQYSHALLVQVAAAEIARTDGNAKLQVMRSEASASGDQLKAQEVADYQAALDRLDKRTVDLKLTMVATIQFAPQIRLVQNNDKGLVEAIQSSILNTIPIWKRQIILAIALYNQKRALELQRSVREATNEMLLKNAEMLGQQTKEVGEETQKGVIELETLRTVNQKLIESIQTAIATREEGRRRRAEVEAALPEIPKALQQALLAAATPPEAKR